MGKVEDALRDLIQYHGRKAARDVLEGLPDRVRRLREETRELRAAVESMQGDLEKLLEARRERMNVPPAPEKKVSDARVTRRTVRSLRKRFDLTQAELADLLDVSAGSITLWETGKTRPAGENAARIVTLREMQKSQVDEVLGRTSEGAGVSPADIRGLRNRLGLTLKELASLIEVSGNSVANWEAGRTSPDPENRQRIEELQEMSEEEAQEELLSMSASYLDLSPEDVRDIRKQMGFSQGEFAGKLGVSPGTISNWETGRSRPRPVNVKQLQKLAENIS